MTELKYFFYRSMRVCMRPLIFVYFCFNDEKIVMHARLKRDFKARRENKKL